MSKPTSSKIDKLQDEGDLYTRKIEQEKRRIQMLDEKLARMHQKILDQKQKIFYTIIQGDLKNGSFGLILDLLN